MTHRISLRDTGRCATIAAAMLDQATQRPTSIAFLWLRDEQMQSVGWLEVAAWVHRISNRLNHVAIGAHVASCLPNGPVWIALDLACQLLGLVHVAIDPRWPDSALHNFVEHSCTTVLVYPAARAVEFENVEMLTEEQLSLELAQPVSELQSHLDELKVIAQQRAVTPVQQAQLLYTSGTGAQPRGVLLSHRNLVSNAFAKLDAAPQFATDLRLNILPFSHAYARTCELSTWILSGGQLAIACDWQDFLRLAQRLKPTLVNLVPHLVHKLCQASEPREPCVAPELMIERLGGRVRLLQVGGAALSNALWNRLAAVGLPPLQGYGLTEASPVVCSNRAGQQRSGCVGPPVAGVEVRIDEAGQLWTRGEQVMLGYWRDAIATRERVQDGWLATGDLATWSGDAIQILGRQSEQLVLSNGYKVMPRDLETRLESLSSVAHACVVSVADKSITALIWPCERVDAECREQFKRDLLTQCPALLSDLPGYMQVREVVIIEEAIDQFVTNKGSWRRQIVAEYFASKLARVGMSP